MPRSLYLWLVLACVLLAAFISDGRVLAAVHPLHQSRLADLLNHTVRWLGNGKFQVPALGLMIGGAFVLTRQPRHPAIQAGCWALLAFLISGAAAGALKVLVGRARPWVLPPYPQTLGDHFRGDYQAFPSGESATVFAIAFALGAFLPRLRLLLLGLAGIVAVARVLVGAHHPSDVVAGAMLGLAVGQGVTRAARRGASPGSAGSA